MSKMKVLMTIYYSKNTGGAEISTNKLAKHLKDAKIEVVVASTSNYDVKTYNFIKFNPIVQPFRLQELYLSKFLSNVIKKEEIDIVHAQDRLTSLGAIKACKKLKIPVIVHFRDYWFACPESSCLKKNYQYCETCNFKNLLACGDIKFLWNLYKYITLIRRCPIILNSADEKIAISQAVKEKLEFCGLKNAKVVPNPVNVEEFWEANGRDIRERYDLDDEIVISFIGGLSYHKGIINFLKVAEDISINYPNIKFLVVGDGPLKKECIDFSLNKNLKDCVVFTGKVSNKEIPKYYKASDIIAFPSIWQEPFGRIAIEGMASGKPIVASDIGGISDIVRDGKNGFLCNPFNLKEFKQKLEILIGDKELRNKMGEKGLKLAKEKYDEKVIANQIVKIYKEIL
ncbi:hypothetical protein C5S30_01985 [ANME-1 cluster archaeon GoMg4]|nr:hypothetical protein [ANME-1 cluster archaeon GoMg4]